MKLTHGLMASTEDLGAHIAGLQTAHRLQRDTRLAEFKSITEQGTGVAGLEAAHALVQVARRTITAVG